MQEAGRRLIGLRESTSLELMSQRLLSVLASDSMPMLSRGLIAPTVTPTDRLYLSDTVHHFVVPRPDGTAELRWAGDNITLSAQELQWIARIDEGATAKDLGGAEALAFCQRLASMGLLTVQPAAAGLKAAE
jgi:hypothetical protein